MTGEVDVLGQYDFLDVWNHERSWRNCSASPSPRTTRGALAEFGIDGHDAARTSRSGGRGALAAGTRARAALRRLHGRLRRPQRARCCRWRDESIGLDRDEDALRVREALVAVADA